MSGVEWCNDGQRYCHDLRAVVEGLRTQLATWEATAEERWHEIQRLGAQVAAVKVLLNAPHDTEAGNDCIACNLPRLIRAALESRLS